MAHRAHHRPVSQPSEKFERRVGGEDPAARDVRERVDLVF